MHKKQNDKDCPVRKMLETVKVVNTINNKPKKRQYRIGDAIFLGNSAVEQIYDSDSPYTDTIGYAYIKNMLESRTMFNWSDIRAENRCVYENPVETLAVHLRLGDWKSICRNEHAVRELTKNIIHTVTQNNIQRVVLVTAYHWCVLPEWRRKKMLPGNEASLEYIINALQRCTSVDIMSSTEPDDDFRFLINSKHLMVTQGFFSILAGVCNPNNVYYGLDRSDVKITGRVGNIKTNLHGSIQSTINYYKKNSNIRIPDEVDTSILGDDSELNFYLQDTLMGAVL